MLYLADVRSHWHWVRDGVAQVKAEGDYPWIPEDAYAKLTTDSSYALVLDDSGTDEFAICRIEHDALSDEKVLFIWIAWSREGDAITRLVPEWLELANKVGCAHLRWSSDRPGYQKLLKNLRGFHFQYEYSISVHPECP